MDSYNNLDKYELVEFITLTMTTNKHAFFIRLLIFVPMNLIYFIDLFIKSFINAMHLCINYIHTFEHVALTRPYNFVN